MKNTMIFALIILSSFSNLFSQDSIVNNKNYKNEIGMDMNTFVRQVLNFGSQTYVSPNTYLITYKRLIKEKNSIRFGLGGNYETQKDTGGYNSNTNQTYKNEYFNARIGFEQQNNLGKYFIYYYGLDVLGGCNYNLSHNFTTSSGTPDVISKTFSIGIGPLLGLKFKITQRIYISTESNIYYLYSKQVRDYKYKNSPDKNKKELHEDGTIKLSPPLYINLAIDF